MENKKVKRIAYIFLAAAVIVGVLIAGSMFVRPYDDGSLAPFNSSGNLAFSGKAAATSAYEFYCLPGDGLYRYNTSEETTEKIADGEVSCINPADGDLFYVLGGTIVKSDYLGLMKSTVVDDVTVERMSVNGYWVYFTDTDGSLYKMRRDGSDRRNISPEGLRVDSFTADNRRVVFMSGDSLYVMKSDATGLECLETDGVARFNYSSDNLFYSKDSQVQMKFQYVGGFTEEQYPPYEAVGADLFNYCFSSEGAGLMYYIDGDKICLRKLFVIKEVGEEGAPEETVEVITLPGVRELYCVGYHMYAYTDSGEVHRISLDGNYKGTATVLTGK